MMVRIGDFVLLNTPAGGGEAGEVKACLMEDGEFFVILLPAKLIHRLSVSSATYRFEGPLKVSDAVRVELAFAWYWVGGDVAVLER